MKKNEITLKNTKAEILEALNASLEREKKLASIKSNPEALQKKQKVEQAINDSKKNVSENIFSSELIQKFNDLEVAIKAQEEKLETLYGVDKELSDLVVVVNGAKDLMNKLDEDKKNKTLEINSLITSLEEEYSKKNDEIKKSYEEEVKSLKLQRDREAEEYNYNLKREREISNNKWEDEKKIREKKLADSEAEVKRSLDEIKENTEHVKDLEKQVAGIPDLLVKEYEKGKKEVSTLLNKEHKYEIDLLSKDFQSKIDRQADKIESLESEINKALELNNSLQERLDKAYAQIKEMATKTVEATGGVKIIGNSQNE